MHVPHAPQGLHPIGNYRVQVDPTSGEYGIDVQLAGRWHRVHPRTSDDRRLIITVLQSPFAAVQDGWIVGSRAPTP